MIGTLEGLQLRFAKRLASLLRTIGSIGGPAQCALGGIVAVVFVVYMPSTAFCFTNYDDYTYVAGNPVVRSGLNGDSLRLAFTAQVGYYSPLAWLSFALECTIFPFAGPGIFRTTNILLHALNTCLVYRLLAGLHLTGGQRVVVVALFALHPVQVESVVWISERKGLLACLFFLLSAQAYLRHHDLGNSLDAANACVYYQLSVLSKPSCLLAPLLFISLKFFGLLGNVASKGEREDSRFCRLDTCLATAMLVSCIFHVMLQEGTLDSWSASQLSLARCFGSYCAYLAKIIYPTDLLIPYPPY